MLTMKKNVKRGHGSHRAAMYSKEACKSFKRRRGFCPNESIEEKAKFSKKKAIDRENADLESIENAMMTDACMVAESQSHYTEEIDGMLHTILREEQQCIFEPLPDEVVSDSDPFMSSEIPYLPGLDRCFDKNPN